MLLLGYPNRAASVLSGPGQGRASEPRCELDCALTLFFLNRNLDRYRPLLAPSPMMLSAFSSRLSPFPILKYLAVWEILATPLFRRDGATRPPSSSRQIQGISLLSLFPFDIRTVCSFEFPRPVPKTLFFETALEVVGIFLPSVVLLGHPICSSPSSRPPMEAIRRPTDLVSIRYC